MNICTIATADWIDPHLARWLRYVKANAGAGHKLHLILAADDAGLMTGEHPVVGQFDDVRAYSSATFTRPWCNEVRMGATTLFGVDEMLYLDADADVLGDLGEIPGLVGDDARLGWVLSPKAHTEWMNLSARLYGRWPGWTANNCLLYLRDDFTDAYKAAVEKVDKHAPNPRIKGTFAFNAMLLEMGEGEHVRLPDEYGVCWWDADKWLGARVIQCVNDGGKDKRERLERLWGAVKGDD
jgi:hypothetical protein